MSGVNDLYDSRGWEADQRAATKEDPRRKHYRSGRACTRHGATPLRYVSTMNCIGCNWESGHPGKTFVEADYKPKTYPAPKLPDWAKQP
jgi:hypothetical protein